MSKDNFTDWYIPDENPSQGFVYPGPIRISESGTLIQSAIDLCEACREKDTEEFTVRYEGRVYRGHRIDGVEGYVYQLRRVPNIVPDITRLGLDKAVQALLLHKKLNQGGMILVAGETGQGKSTTSASMIKARMERYGSFALTLENPPELPLHGHHGASGLCIQTDVKSGSFGDAIRGAMRCYPTQGNNILFVGEVRDPETAGEALRIAINGHLVITSIHGGDVISAMKRLMALALSYKNMSEAEARSVFSSAFRMCVHQRLRDTQEGIKKLDAQVLFSPSHASVIANRIRQGQLEALSTEIQQQAKLLASGQLDKMLEVSGSAPGLPDRS